MLKSESLFREALTEGLSQSANDASLPDVYIRRNIWSFITKEIDEIFPENFARTVSHPAKSDSAHGASKSLLSLREVPQSCHNELVIAIGGERGWHEGELELLQKNRFEIVNIGPRIYRSDTAVSVRNIRESCLVMYRMVRYALRWRSVMRLLPVGCLLVDDAAL